MQQDPCAWKHALIRGLFNRPLTEGLAQLVVFAALDDPHQSPDRAAAILATRCPEQSQAIQNALATIYQARICGHALDRPEQFLGALWMTHGAQALTRAILSTPACVIDAIADEIPPRSVDEGAYVRVRRAAVEAWNAAEYGVEPVSVQ